MAEITKTQTVGEISGLVTNKYNRIEVTSSATSLQLTESNLSNAETVFVGGLALTLKEDGTYRVDGRGDVVSNDISIPSTYNSSPVTEIASNAFSGDTSLESIHIPESVTNIGGGAFKGCTYLKNVTIEEDGVLPVFFQIPENSTGWENPYVQYLYGSAGESSATFPGKAMHLVDSYNRIYACELPLDTYSVMFNQGSNDGERTSIYTLFTDNPAVSVFTTVPVNTQPGVPTLINYNLKYLEDYEPSSNGSDLTINNYAFQGCNSLTTMELPRRTKYVGNYAFAECKSLQSVSIGSLHRLSKIGARVFSNCTNLTQVSFKNGIKHIGVGAFSGCENLKVFNWASTLITIGWDAFRNCIRLNDFTIPASVKTIGMNAFVWDDYSGGRYIAFEDPYTWFISKDETVDPRNLELQHPTHIHDGKTGSQSSVTLYNGMRLSYPQSGDEIDNCGDYYWHKLKQMPAPEISISNGILTMTDPLGQAEHFYIYVNGKKKVTIEAD